MDKNNIKNRLSERFLSEESTPGIKVTADMRKKSGEINKKGVGAEAKDAIDYNKSLKQDKDTSKMATNKFNYEDGFQKTYHDEMEIMNGQEMIQYDSKPSKEFTDRAIEAIEGSTRMGNKGGKGVGNAEATWGASSDDFGKNLVKRIKSSEKKRSEQTPTLNLRGANIQADIKDTGHKPYAIEENKTNNNKPQIKESMKRLKFKKEFNGVGNALKLIPESYKVDTKEFEMTDGNETYRIRWEGTLSEGSAVVLTANDKKMVNEDIQRMKALFGYKSQDTLGLVKGNARIDENKVFGDIWNKSKRLLGESEEIEGQTADKTAPFEEAGVKQAAEAKKHVQGSVSTEKGTQAPKPKTGNWEDNVKGQAAEAKKHVEGSVSTEKGTQAPKAKEGEWEEIDIKASEATEHMESGKSTNKATNKAKVVVPAKAVNESLGEEDDEEEAEDDYNKPDADDDADMDAEPSAKDIKPEVPPLDNSGDEEDVLAPTNKVPSSKDLDLAKSTILFSKSTGTYWIKSPNLETGMAKVPDEFLGLASDSSIKASKRAEMILDKMSEMDNEEELDEYAEEPAPGMHVVGGKIQNNKEVDEYAEEPAPGMHVVGGKIQNGRKK